MTRNRKVDPALLEREYIFDSGNPPVSITQLADKYGMARSGIAEKSREGRWFERRKEFREQLGEKVVAALGDEWVGFETATREKMMQVGLKYLDKYAEALDAGQIKPNTRDMLGVAAMIRTFLNDTASSPRGEEALIDPNNATFSPAYARQIIDAVDQLNAGRVDDGHEPDEPGHAGGAEAPSDAGTGEG